MTDRPGSVEPEPPGGNAAERLRDLQRRRSGEPPPEPAGKQELEPDVEGEAPPG